MNKDKDEALFSGACSTVDSIEQSGSNFDITEPEINLTDEPSSNEQCESAIKDTLVTLEILHLMTAMVKIYY